MTTIGGINYQIDMDVSQFSEGNVLTRREMQITRRELKASREPFAALGDSIDAVKKSYAAGAITADEFHRIMVKLSTETPQAKAAQADYNATAAHAEKVLASLITPMQAVDAELALHKKALDIGKLTEAEYAAAVEQSRAKLPQMATASELASQQATALTASLRDQIATIGMSAAELEHYRLAQAGASQAELDQVAALQQTLAQRQATSAANQQAADSLSTITAALREQLATIGMSADELDRHRLAQQGVRDADLAEVAALQDAIAQRQAADAANQQAAASLGKVTAALREEIATFGMSADELDRHRLAQQGVSDADLEAVAALQQQRAALEATAQAEQELANDMAAGAAIVARNQTEQEKYNAELAEAKRLFDAGAIGEEDMAREAARLHGELKSVKKAQDELDEELAEAKQLTESLMTHEERRNAELARSRGLLDRGRISQDTHNRLLTKQRQEMLQNIPVVGNLSSRFMGIHPAAIAAGVGIGIVAAEMKAAIEVARWLTREVREQFVELDKLGKSSAKLGMSVGDLVSFGTAAGEITGMEFGAFETAVQRMTRRVAEAAQGSGEALKTIQELGLDANQLQLAGPAGQLDMFADAFQGVTDEGDRLRLAMRLFDTEGAALGTMLAKGSDELRTYRDELEAIGGIPSPFDTASVEAMNDAVGRAEMAVSGVMRDLAVGLAPVIQAVAEEMTESLSEGSQLGDSIRMALEGIPPVIAWAADQTNLWIGGFQLLGATATNAAAGVVGALAAIDRAQAKVNPFAEVNEELQTTAEVFAQQAQDQTTDALNRITSGATGQMAADVKRIRGQNARTAMENERQLAGGRDVEAEVEAGKAAAAMMERMQEQVRTFGMTEAAALSMELRQRAVAAAAVDTTGKIGDQIAILNAEADAIDALSAELQQLKEQQAATDAVNQLTASLQEQLATIGMTADEIARYKLAQQGALAEDVAMIQQTQELLAIKQAQAEHDKQLADSIAQTTAALEFQIATTGMTAEAIELYKLEQAGATREQRAAIAALQAEAKARSDQQKLIDEGKSLTESLINDEERKAAAIAKATELRDAGAISEEMYQRALAKTNGETQKQIDLASGVDGALQGSLEAAMSLDRLANLLGSGKASGTLPEPHPGGFDAGGSAARPPESDAPAVDVQAIRDQLNQNLDRPPAVDVQAIRDQLNQNLNRPPAIDVQAIRDQLNQNLDRPPAVDVQAIRDQLNQNIDRQDFGSTAATAEFDQLMADITQRFQGLSGTSGSGATPSVTSPPKVDLNNFDLSDASAIDRLVDMMAKTNELLSAVVGNTKPQTDRSPNDNEVTFRVID